MAWRRRRGCAFVDLRKGDRASEPARPFSAHGSSETRRGRAILSRRGLTLVLALPLPLPLVQRCARLVPMQG